MRSLAWANTTDTGGAVPKPVFGDVVLTKAPDRSSPQLWQRSATGQHLAQAVVTLLAPGVVAPYGTFTFKDVVVREVTTRGAGDERTEQVRLGFSSLVSGSPAFAFDPSAPPALFSEPRVGRMTVDGLPGTMELALDTWGVANAGGTAGGGGGGGIAAFAPFAVSKPVDDRSAALLARFRSGVHTKKITVDLLQPGSEDVYSTYVLTDVVIASYGIAGDARPLEELALDAARIESTVPVPGGQPVRACFDRKLLQSC